MRFVFVLLLTAASFGASHAQTEPRYLDWVVTSKGFGPLHLGMSTADASRAFGRDVTQPDAGGSFIDGSDCSSYAFGRGPKKNGFLKAKHWDFRLLLTNGTVRTIDIYASGLKTDRGIGVGSSRDVVLAAYPTSKEDTGHYGDRRLTVSLTDGAILRFVLDSAPSVRYFTIGLEPEINYVEGCL